MSSEMFDPESDISIRIGREPLEQSGKYPRKSGFISSAKRRPQLVAIGWKLPEYQNQKTPTPHTIFHVPS
jgi:hypothetical protein